MNSKIAVKKPDEKDKERRKQKRQCRMELVDRIDRRMAENTHLKHSGS